MTLLKQLIWDKFELIKTVKNTEIKIFKINFFFNLFNLELIKNANIGEDFDIKTIAVVLDDATEHRLSKENKKIVITNIESFYNYRTIGFLILFI